MNAVAEFKPKPASRLSHWEDFQSEIRQREQELASQLPSNVSRERFINAAIAAVKQSPDILSASPRSLFAAITKAAQDGLLPDGREGVITVYKGEASWNPMTFGMRKRARELDDIIVNAQVVYSNDHFERTEGDNPHIDHRPAKLGQPRGTMIGAYAIYKMPNDYILHREVMDAEQIAQVREQSRAKGGLMWTTFTAEAWRKTVVRRGFKSVPCSPRLEQLIRRDDDQFDFETAPTLEPPSPPSPPSPPTIEQDVPVVDESHEAATGEQEFDAAKFFEDLETALSGAHDADEIESVWVEFDVESVLADDEINREIADKMKARHLGRLSAPAADDQSDMFPGDRR